MIGLTVAFYKQDEQGQKSKTIYTGKVLDKVFGFLSEKYLIVEPDGEVNQVPTSFVTQVLNNNTIDIQSNEQKKLDK